MLMKNKLMFTFFLLIFSSSYAQQVQYLIITFESKRNIDKNFQKYYWIAPIDSIKDTSFYLYPLYLVVGEFSKDNLDDCQKGDSIDIFISTNETRLGFSKEYESDVDNLMTLIDNNRTEIQTISIGWTENKKAKDKIIVYATPISGDLCSCFQYHNIGNKNFQSFVYLPIANFNYVKSFWQSSTASIVKFANYSFIDYKSHLLYKKGVQYGSHKKIK